MNTLFLICLAGGLLSILTFIHFVIDWVFQSHKEAMAKHNNASVRAKHCATYTFGFFPLLIVLMYIGSLSAVEFVLATNILFWSHFIEDTYYPVFLWAKYIRRPAEMTTPVTSWATYGVPPGKSYLKVGPPDPKEGFIKFIDTTLGKILMIAIDQIIHITFLLPIVWMALN